MVPVRVADQERAAHRLLGRRHQGLAEAMGATIRYHDLVEGVFEIHDIRVRTSYLNHPALTLGYRLEADGVSAVYACDHEPVSKRPVPGSEELQGKERRHVEFIEGADLVIHDCQYTAAEYADKVGWGHSTPEYAAAVCHAAGVKKLALTHHDPTRSDDSVGRIVARIREACETAARPLDICAAAEGQTIDLGVVAGAQTRTEADDFSAVTHIDTAIDGHSVMLGVVRPAASEVIRDAAQAENVRLVSERSIDEMLRIIREDPPSLVILDAHAAPQDARAICRALRSTTTETSLPVPIAIVAAHDDEEASGIADPDIEWLIWPFRLPYVRTKIRAWVLRMKCMWLEARLPDNEEARLAELHGLGVLDTEPEERFDRLTRIASAAMEAPIALVSLVDRDRQWFKSCIGLGAKETPREMAFCAHAILGEEVLVVPDTLVDPRFADNPLVTGDPRIRFYAGCPVRSAGDLPLGTLCVIDTRPRQLDDRHIDLLKDLASLVEMELSRPADALT
jgi:CheY-like chemotaxis protein